MEGDQRQVRVKSCREIEGAKGRKKRKNAEDIQERARSEKKKQRGARTPRRSKKKCVGRGRGGKEEFLKTRKKNYQTEVMGRRIGRGERRGKERRKYRPSVPKRFT